MNTDESVIVVCPKCSAEQEDLDGFGVLYCDECHYCTHPSRDGDGKGGWVCGICGDVKADTPGYYSFPMRLAHFALRMLK